MSKHKLLLADDSITIQKVVNLTFADEGIEVIAVGDGDTAMRKFIEVMPDLVMADVNMPGLNGYRLCEKIKQNSDTQKIPVILLVGSFEPFDEAEANRVGADDFLTKPFQSIRQLVNKVSDLLDSKNDAETSTASSEDSAKTVNSFDDTLEMNPVIENTDEPNSSLEDLGDAGMDDEMIQTAQIGSLPADESQKFVSKPVDESFAEDVDLTALKQPYNSENPFESEKEDWAKTQPLSREDYEAITTASTKTEIRQTGDSLYEFDGRQEFAEDDAGNEAAQIYPGENRISQTFASSETASDLDFDDLDLLGFSGITKKVGFSESDSKTSSEIPEPSKSAANETSNGQSEISDASTQLENLSPATIDAIADKIAEKISDKIIKEVVREVVAQMEKRK